MGWCAIPVRSIIECGKPCMENGIIPGVDFAKLRDAAWAGGLGNSAAVGPARRSAEEGCPYCYPETG